MNSIYGSHYIISKYKDQLFGDNSSIVN